MLQANLACLAADSTAAAAAADQQVVAFPDPALSVVSTAPLIASATPVSTPAAMAETTNAPAKTSAPSLEPLEATTDDADYSNDRSILKSPLLVAAGEPASGFVLSGGASISPDQAPDKIDLLTKQILLKEIELERFNLHYTQEVNIQGRWKGWRYGGLQEVNGALVLTGAIISVAYRGARLEDAKAVKPCIQESSNYISMTGAYIGAGAAVMEFGVNAYHDAVARHHGFGPTEAINNVARLKGEIERMMAERDSLIRVEGTSAALSGQTQLDVAEGKVLGDMLNESLAEFERFHVGARRNIAFQQTQYFLDMSKYVLNALGYQFAFLSLHDHHRRFNGNAGALFMTSGGVMIGAPLVSRLFAKGVAELTRSRYEHAVGHGFKGGSSTLEQDLAGLDSIAKSVRISNNSERAADRVTDRFANYEEHQKTYSNEIRERQKNKNKAVLSATQNIGASIYIGGSKVASGVLFGCAGFNHIYNAGSESIEADRVTNDDLFASSVIAIPATAFSMLDTLRIQVKGEIQRKKAKDQGLLVSQITAKRLTQLDAMEARLKAAAIR